eukprot:CAMPEP_0181234282 /NCGR_PEP_ID=MMETSP1096-20121128/36865_1 /TAXON_ID=156174 ORGANISM="Chrysochromulina ericina, Strain CCMP281" /NCGR_SAMPLE_ID=MMETSP1096 /ASSEMBLY_ACC=CAM_ASM_000453 /LENGTH=93 /DNA_ID=CAMNT_0023328997 /DNA_START=450 /DNA_END=727 /DNA_ORIENTATION=-
MSGMSGVSGVSGMSGMSGSSLRVARSTYTLPTDPTRRRPSSHPPGMSARSAARAGIRPTARSHPGRGSSHPILAPPPDPYQDPYQPARPDPDP